jgi:hypothetical protein
VPHARSVLPPLAVQFPTPDDPVSQYQFPTGSAYPTGRSPSRGAVHAAAAAQTHHQQSMGMTHASLDRNPPSSRVPPPLPYARAPPVISPGSYETRPLFSDPRDIQVADTEPTIKKKRKRADARQLEALNRMYARTAFPSTEERLQLAKELDMSARSVQIWLAHTFVHPSCMISELSTISFQVPEQKTGAAPRRTKSRQLRVFNQRGHCISPSRRPAYSCTPPSRCYPGPYESG